MVPLAKRVKLLVAAVLILISGVAYLCLITVHIQLFPATLTDDESISPPDLHASQSSQCQAIAEPENISENQEELREPWDSLNFVLGPPGNYHIDNLRNDTYYITAWANAGFTNQFMGYVNLIYLGLISDRVPVLPPFAPDHHIDHAAGVIPFSDIFNLSTLRKTLRTPILEWSDLKTLPHPTHDPYTNPHVEHVGCWSVRSTRDKGPVHVGNVERHLGLDIAYTLVPEEIRWRPEEQGEDHVVFDKLSALVFPGSDVGRNLPPSWKSPMGENAPPGERLACLDPMYYVTSGLEIFEWFYPWSPPWRRVGKHLFFADRMIEMAEQYLQRVMRVDSVNELRPFISVHIRRGDFGRFCLDDIERCFPPFANYVDKVHEVQEELREKLGHNVPDVLVMSDETNPDFWAQVQAQGWMHINHAEEQTAELHSAWYPALVDIVVQSLGVGFVGTHQSTFSLVSKRRVEDWNSGATRWVMMPSY